MTVHDPRQPPDRDSCFFEDAPCPRCDASLVVAELGARDPLSGFPVCRYYCEGEPRHFWTEIYDPATARVRLHLALPPVET
jgi:hypothetical protein